MALHVIATAPAEFDTWRERQRRPAAASLPFFDLRCGACHVVRGTNAAGARGPDLTHVASRRFIAAGTLANTPDGMAAWLADSQHAKPGNLMPSMRLTQTELQAVAAYMATLR
jgi:cytochrome c oxidase subunit 2